MIAPIHNRDELEEAMEMIVDGTRGHVSRPMKDYGGYLGHFNNWTG